MSASATLWAFPASPIGDPDSTRTVLAVIALLVVMGVGLVMLAFWLRRETRPDPELLAPLELMDQRAWRNGDPVWQRRRLDEVRPPGAVPLTRAAAPPTVDESFDAGPTAGGFDDLHQPEGDAAIDEAVDGEPDAVDGDAGGDGSATEPEDLEAYTPIATSRPLDDFTDLTELAIDPNAAERAIGELDVTAIERAMAQLDREVDDTE
jgi:hypothetical protein